MTHLLLAHLSHNNNNPDIVHDLFNGQSGGIRVVVASRYEETAVYTIQGAPGDKPQPWVDVTQRKALSGQSVPATSSAETLSGSATVSGSAIAPGSATVFGSAPASGPSATAAAKSRRRPSKEQTVNPLQLPLFE